MCVSLLETCVGVNLATSAENHLLLSDGRARSVERIGRRTLVLDDGEDVLLAHDQQLIAVDLELVPGVLGVEDLVALLDVDRLALAVVEDPAWTDREDRALLGLLLGGVRQDD